MEYGVGLWRESLWPCEHALVRQTPKTAAEVAFFGRLLAVTPGNQVKNTQQCPSIPLLERSPPSLGSDV